MKLSDAELDKLRVGIECGMSVEACVRQMGYDLQAVRDDPANATLRGVVDAAKAVQKQRWNQKEK